MTLEVNFQCVFAQKSVRPCGGGGGPVGGGNGVPRHARMQTLDELDAAALGGGVGASTVGVIETVGQNQVKVSWIILSRAGVNYLAHGAGGAGAGAGRWLICPAHRGEYLEEWSGASAAAPCSYPTHDAAVPRTPARHPLTLAASARILQGEGKVAPIGGRCCDACRARHDAAYPPKAKGEKVVLVVPRTPALAPPAPSLEVPSPFCTLPPPEVARASPTNIDLMSAPSPFAAPVQVHDATSPQITIKMEVVEEEPERMPTPLPYQEDITIKVEGENEQHTQGNHDDIQVDDTEDIIDEGEQTEEEEEDIDGLFSDDSDDDRTWMPATSSTANKSKKNTRSKKRGRDPDKSSDDDDDDETAMPPPPKAPKRKKNAKAKDKTTNENNGNGKLYFCQICQITFYKHASYRQHMRSSKKAHQDIKAKESSKLGPEIFECIDCKIAFKDRATQVSISILLLLVLPLLLTFCSTSNNSNCASVSGASHADGAQQSAARLPLREVRRPPQERVRLQEPQQQAPPAAQRAHFLLQSLRQDLCMPAGAQGPHQDAPPVVRRGARFPGNSNKPY